MKNLPLYLRILFPFIPVFLGTLFVLMLPKTSSPFILWSLSIIVPIGYGVFGYFIGKMKVRPIHAILTINASSFIAIAITLIFEVVRYFVEAEIEILDYIYYYSGFFASHFAASLAHLTISFTGIGYNVMYLGVIFLLFSYLLGYFTGYAAELSKKEAELYDKTNG